MNGGAEARRRYAQKFGGSKQKWGAGRNADSGLWIFTLEMGFHKLQKSLEIIGRLV